MFIDKRFLFLLKVIIKFYLKLKKKYFNKEILKFKIIIYKLIKIFSLYKKNIR